MRLAAYLNIEKWCSYEYILSDNKLKSRMSTDFHLRRRTGLVAEFSLRAAGTSCVKAGVKFAARLGCSA